MLRLGIWLLALVGIVLLCTVAGAIGGGITSSAQGTISDSNGVTYADFIVIMLTSVTLVITVLAVIVAVAAFVGWQSFDDRVKSEVSSVLDRGLEPGQPIYMLLKNKTDNLRVLGVQPISRSFESDAEAEGKGEGEY